jgi:hypothetical protein
MSNIQLVYNKDIDPAFHTTVMAHFRRGGPIMKLKHVEDVTEEQERIRFTQIVLATDSTGTFAIALGEDGRIYRNPPISEYLERK